MAKTAIISAQFVLATSVIAVIYGFFARRHFTLAYVFNATFLVGSIIICVALVLMILPIGFKRDKLTDHTTFIERYYMEGYRKKQKKAYEFLFTGLFIIIIAGLVQLFLSFVLVS